MKKQPLPANAGKKPAAPPSKATPGRKDKLPFPIVGKELREENARLKELLYGGSR